MSHQARASAGPWRALSGLDGRHLPGGRQPDWPGFAQGSASSIFAKRFQPQAVGVAPPPALPKQRNLSCDPQSGFRLQASVVPDPKGIAPTSEPATAGFDRELRRADT